MKGGANMDDYTRKFNAAEDKDQQVHYILTTVYESLKEKGYSFSYDDALVSHLVHSSYSAAYGARNLRRCIQKELEDPMAVQIIDSFEHPITQLRATAEDGKVRLDTL